MGTCGQEPDDSTALLVAADAPIRHTDGEGEIRDAFETTLIALDRTDFKTKTEKFEKFGEDLYQATAMRSRRG